MLVTTKVQQTSAGAGQYGAGAPARSSVDGGDEPPASAFPEFAFPEFASPEFASVAVGQYALLFDLTHGNAEAILKAATIFARGLNMLQTAVVGSACMAVDDAVSEARVAMSCRNWPRLMAFEAENAPISAYRYLLRAYTLYRMATQLIEDAAFPLDRRFAMAMGMLRPKAR